MGIPVAGSLHAKKISHLPGIPAFKHGKKKILCMMDKTSKLGDTDSRKVRRA